MSTFKITRTIYSYNGTTWSKDSDAALAWQQDPGQDIRYTRITYNRITVLNPIKITHEFKTSPLYSLRNQDSYTVAVINPTIGAITVNPANTITITCNSTNNVVLTGDSLSTSNWAFTTTNGIAISPLSVTAVNKTIVITTTNQTIGATYTLSVPNGIVDATGLVCTGPFSFSFTGLGTAPALLYSRSIDAHNIEICYSDKMDLNTTLNTLNYTISPTLTVNSVTQITNNIFHISTSRQTSGTTYTITVNNGSTGVQSIYLNKVQ